MRERKRERERERERERGGGGGEEEAFLHGGELYYVRSPGVRPAAATCSSS